MTVRSRGISVRQGRGVYKDPLPERNPLLSFGCCVSLVLASFPGSEVAFEYDNREPALDAQAEEVRRWNEWVSVLNDDRTARA